MARISTMQQPILAAPKVGRLSPPEAWSSSRSLTCPLTLHKLLQGASSIPLPAGNTKYAFQASQGKANGSSFNGGKVKQTRKHVAHPALAPTRKAGRCTVIAAPAPTITAARTASRPVETVMLSIITGTEGDAGMFGSAKVTFVSKQGERYPPNGLEISGPFAHSTRKDPKQCKLPVGFEVAGIIVENPKDMRIDIRVLAWLAHRLDVKIPVVNQNLLNLLTSLPFFKRLTDGDWYIYQLELAGGTGAGEKQVFPLFGWVEEASVRLAFDGTAYLPQDTPPGLTSWRRKALIVNQNAYNYQPYNDLSKPPNNDNYLSPDFRPTLDPYPQHVQAPRTGPDAGTIPRDETFGLSKSKSFTQGTLRGAVNLLWALLNNGGTGPILVRDVAAGVAVGYFVGTVAEQFLTPDVLAAAGQLLDGLLPGAVQSVVWFVFGKLPVKTAAGGLAGLATGLALLLNDVKKLSYTSVEAYAKSCFKHDFRLGPLLIGYQEPWVYTLGEQQPDKAWNTDFMFGWQTVAGINPESITLVTSEKQIIGGGTITEEDLQKVKKELPTFDKDLKNKQIFILDFSVLYEFMNTFNNEAGKKAGKHLYAPVVLLRQADNEHLGVPVPIAVKLAKGEDEIVTPGSDSSQGKWGWTLAKAIAASGNSGVHQLGQHWLRTHAVCETYALAMRRQLSEVHPLFKLLIPHTRYTMDINNKARVSLINTNGVIESNFSPGPEAMQVSAAAYRGWRFENENPEQDLKARGVLDKSALPNYPYREHALEVWGALREYVREYVDLYYTGSQDIADDYELQAFWADVKQAHSSLDTWLKIPANLPKGAEPGLVWPDLKTKDDLVMILGTIMWAGSAMHSVVNFGQYDYAAFVPNSPASIRGEFDYAKLRAGEYTERDFMAAMPTAFEMTTVMTVVEALVVHAGDEQYLGQQSEAAPPGVYPPELTADPWLVDDKASQVYDRFVARVNKAQEKLEGLNKAAEKAGSPPYYYLLPRKDMADWDRNVPAQGVPNSVTI
ncbi:lipoxygenase [Klebsormidium nitens]|uniref:Lipoxygenase n=1 Tax=Klebsormidium nitens TaxID=105231 RepID=A0A1Y1HTY2_KLENI|nr:lipoxygenase [Klebsormidium nitens]|eukprot:GAQ79298.1 lipoxygenase [Klebsormidium nitens]